MWCKTLKEYLFNTTEHSFLMSHFDHIIYSLNQSWHSNWVLEHNRTSSLVHIWFTFWKRYDLQITVEYIYIHFFIFNSTYDHLYIVITINIESHIANSCLAHFLSATLLSSIWRAELITKSRQAMQRWNAHHST